MTVFHHPKLQCYFLQYQDNKEWIIFVKTALVSASALESYIQVSPKRNFAFRTTNTTIAQVKKLRQKYRFTINKCYKNSLFLDAISQNPAQIVAFDMNKGFKSNIASLNPFNNSEIKRSKYTFRCESEEAAIFDPWNHFSCKEKFLTNRRSCYKLCEHSTEAMLHVPISTEANCLKAPVILGEDTLPARLDLTRAKLGPKLLWSLFLLEMPIHIFQKSTAWSAFWKALMNQIGMPVQYYGLSTVHDQAAARPVSDNRTTLVPSVLSRDILGLSCTSGWFEECMRSLANRFYHKNLFNDADYCKFLRVYLIQKSFFRDLCLVCLTTM